MKSLSKWVLISLLAPVLFSASQARADITTWGYSNPTSSDSNLHPTHWANNGAAGADLTLGGSQYDPGAQLDATFNTDTTTDPTINIEDTILNSTGYNWTSYDLSVFMPNPFTVPTASVNTPATWLPSVGSQFYNNVLNEYETDVTFTGSPSIAPGSTLDFQYSIAFSGQTSYQFTEQLTPVPEPAGLGFLVAALILVLANGRAFLRRAQA